VNEEDFWTRLEFRICAEFRGFDDPELRRNWCDGLIADDEELLLPKPCIRGRAWCGPTGQDNWTFTLILDSHTRSREDIDWAALLPSDQLTGWLSPDLKLKTMTIDPLIRRRKSALMPRSLEQ
jgi:hypothetical protein